MISFAFSNSSDWVNFYSWFQHFHARKALLIRLFGSRAVFLDVNFFFMPVIRAQNDFFRALDFLVLGLGAGAFKLPPVSRLYDLRPFAFNPPDFFFPALRCHAAVFAITSFSSSQSWRFV